MTNLTLFIKRHSLAVYLSLVYLIGWLIQFFARTAQEQGNQGSWTALLALFTFVPGFLAVVLVLSFSDPVERSAFRRRLFTWRVDIHWYALALSIGGGAWLAGAGVATLLGTPINLDMAALGAAPIFLITVFIEEIGWRGFALPHFLSRNSTARSGLVLGIIWAIWHAPDYVREPFGLYAALFATLVIILTTQSIVMTWIFQQVGKVVLPVVLLHWISNVMGGMFYSGDYSVEAMTAFLQVRLAVGLLVSIAAGIVLIYDRRGRQHFQFEQGSQAGASRQSG